MSTANLELDLARLQIQKTLGRFKRETEEAQLHQTNIDEAVEKFKKEDKLAKEESELERMLGSFGQDDQLAKEQEEIEEGQARSSGA